MSTLKPRPVLNPLVCDGKYWISWGPKAPRPDNTTGFHVLTTDVLVSVNGEPHDVWRPIDDELTVAQCREIIDGLCLKLSHAQPVFEAVREWKKVWGEVLPDEKERMSANVRARAQLAMALADYDNKEPDSF